MEPLRLNAKGGLAFAGAVTVYFGPIGIEGRYDSADVDPTADPPVYELRLSSPFPSVSTTVVPSPTEVTVSSLTPLSLNLKLRIARVLSVSGGVSYLPDFQLAVRQPLDLRVGGVGLPGLDLGAVEAEAISRPQDASEDSHVGANLGLGLRLPLSDQLGLVFDARGFYFPEQVLEWRVVQTGGPVTLPPAFLQSSSSSSSRSASTRPTSTSREGSRSRSRPSVSFHAQRHADARVARARGQRGPEA